MSVQTITDWFTKVPVSVPGLRSQYVNLPAFTTVNPTWKGASEIVAQYNFSASANFYLLNRPAKPSGVNYGLCIRYRVGGVVYRYKLWDDDSFILGNVDLYDKHLIKKNFVLEIWSFEGEVNSSQAVAISLWQSLRTVPTDLTVTTSIALAYTALATYADLQNIAPTFSMPAVIKYQWEANTGYSLALARWTDSISGSVLESNGVVPPGYNSTDALFNDKASISFTSTLNSL
ncbi:MAG: hypothetical protein Q7T74_00145, partial [Candidatus Saccharibacteria bacterium]|nr:hypothetical protein [Candidatus Saccharibacteria bacterium]